MPQLPLRDQQEPLLPQPGRGEGRERAALRVRLLPAPIPPLPPGEAPERGVPRQVTVGPRGLPSCGLRRLGLITGPRGPAQGGAWICTWGCVHVSLALQGSQWQCDSLLEAALGIPGPRRVWPAQELEVVGVRRRWHPRPGPCAAPGSGCAEARTVVGSHRYLAGETTHSSGYPWPMHPQLAWHLLFLGPGTH